MAEHIDVGVQGEALAHAWLKEHGYKIVCRNWRYKYYELDVVAEKGGRLHFVEVKTRMHSKYGFPEDAVTKGKFRSLKRAADEYLFQNPGHPWIQYDILAITLYHHQEPEYFLIEDVFL